MKITNKLVQLGVQFLVTTASGFFFTAGSLAAKRAAEAAGLMKPAEEEKKTPDQRVTDPLADLPQDLL